MSLGEMSLGAMSPYDMFVHNMSVDDIFYRQNVWR
jgi:hypothetical protein